MNPPPDPHEAGEALHAWLRLTHERMLALALEERPVLPGLWACVSFALLAADRCQPRAAGILGVGCKLIWDRLPAHLRDQVTRAPMLPPDVAAAVREGRPIPELTLPADVCPSLHAFPTTAELGEWYVAVMMEKIRPLLERHVRKPLPPNLDRTCGLLATLWAMYEERDALAMPLLMAVYQERDTLGEVLRCATSA